MLNSEYLCIGSCRVIHKQTNTSNRHPDCCSVIVCDILKTRRNNTFSVFRQIAPLFDLIAAMAKLLLFETQPAYRNAM